MGRYLIQNVTLGAFLVPDEFNQPRWERNLKQCVNGILSDYENALSMVTEYCDLDDLIQIVDIDEIFYSYLRSCN